MPVPQDSLYEFLYHVIVKIWLISRFFAIMIFYTFQRFVPLFPWGEHCFESTMAPMKKFSDDDKYQLNLLTLNYYQFWLTERYLILIYQHTVQYNTLQKKF